MDPVETVRTYHDAWTSGEVDEAVALCADDFVGTGPDGSHMDRDAWRGYLSAFVPMLTGAPMLDRFADGDTVALFYYPQTAVTESTLAGERFVVRGGRIERIDLAFDRFSYAPPEE